MKTVTSYFNIKEKKGNLKNNWLKTTNALFSVTAEYRKNSNIFPA